LRKEFAISAAAPRLIQISEPPARPQVRATRGGGYVKLAAGKIKRLLNESVHADGE
jgi:hypothetical protein